MVLVRCTCGLSVVDVYNVVQECNPPDYKTSIYGRRSDIPLIKNKMNFSRITSASFGLL
tara:strand:- start:545 stop:721 length:177 start_codon:yes stop_codon:yes gene_type:complete